MLNKCGLSGFVGGVLEGLQYIRLTASIYQVLTSPALCQWGPIVEGWEMVLAWGLRLSLKCRRIHLHWLWGGEGWWREECFRWRESEWCYPSGRRIEIKDWERSFHSDSQTCLWVSCEYSCFQGLCPASDSVGLAGGSGTCMFKNPDTGLEFCISVNIRI